MRDEPGGRRTEIKNVVFDTQVEMSGRQLVVRDAQSWVRELCWVPVLPGPPLPTVPRPHAPPCLARVHTSSWPCFGHGGHSGRWGWRCEVRAFAPQLPPAGSAGGGFSLKGRWKVLAPLRHLATLLGHSPGPTTAPVPASANPGECKVISPLPRGSASPRINHPLPDLPEQKLSPREHLESDRGPWGAPLEPDERD